MVRCKPAPHHRRLLPPVAFALGLLLVTSAAAGARFDHLEVTQRGDSYQIRGDVYLDATPERVYAELMDFKRLPEINRSVRVSKVLAVINAHSQLVYTETVGCVFIFCRSIRQLQRFSEPDAQNIVAVTLTGHGNVKQGRSTWHLQADDGGTRLSWAADIEPDFWVPPFIGPQAIKAELRSQAQESLQALERLSHARGETVLTRDAHSSGDCDNMKVAPESRISL